MGVTSILVGNGVNHGALREGLQNFQKIGIRLRRTSRNGAQSSLKIQNHLIKRNRNEIFGNLELKLYIEIVSGVARNYYLATIFV